jgi:hypothetical protein
MFQFGFANPDFKGFMANNAQANSNVVCIVYNSRGLYENGWQGTNLLVPLDSDTW